MRKKVEDLKAGDIIADRPRCVVLRVTGCRPALPIGLGGGIIETLVAPLDDSSARILSRSFTGTVEVETALLSPAQQYADELLALVREGVAAEVADAPPRQWAMAGIRLLDRIDPPKPPTTQELAQALARAAEVLRHDNLPVGVMEVLERARSVGYFK